MKNIHILQTNKTSRLISLGKEFTLLKNLTTDKRCKNIYITNDEEIKEGDWFIENNNLRICTNGLWAKRGASILTKKIILTTDQDLIKDGVQAIDDDFLEWFIKNPSCENVPIIPPLFGHPYIIWIEGLSFKEEPKQIKCYCGHTTYCDCEPLEEPKQERMYSEEDMKKCWDACERFDRPISEGYAPNFNEFIEQFKKK
jgi:hypothetical protein